MAAAAPIPYRSPSPSANIPGGTPSSSSQTPPVSTKKQQDVEAGRRRWEEFKKKKAQKGSSGPSSNGPSTSTPDTKKQLPVTSSGKYFASPSNGLLHREIQEENDNVVQTTAETSSVPVSNHITGSVAFSGSYVNESIRSGDSKSPFENLSSNDGGVVKKTLLHETAELQTGLSGPLLGTVEYTESVKTSAVPSLDVDLSGAEMVAGSIGSGVFASAPHGSVVTPVLGQPITGLDEQDKITRSSASSLVDSRPLATIPFSKPQRHVGGSLVRTNDRLFPSRGPRVEARPPSSMEPEKELVSGAMATGIVTSSINFSAPDRYFDGSVSNVEAVSSSSGSVALNSSAFDSGIANTDGGSVFAVAPNDSAFSSQLPLSSRSPEHLTQPELNQSALLPFAPTPWFSSSSVSEPFPRTDMTNGSKYGSSLATSAPEARFPNRLSDHLTILSFESANHSFAGVKKMVPTYENGTVESKSNSFPSPSASFEPKSELKGLSERVDPPWQLPPVTSSKEDFSLLEQHIEDLTQEKFSLQRGLDAARVLAETLAQENSALTEDYNNQGAVVNELKEDVEKLSKEIRSQHMLLKNVISEKTLAVQESKASVERAQALAAEVIALEDKMLKVRSQELKLQREVEALTADSESYKRHVASMEKDRTNLRSLVDALQEEKGLLQSRLRQAASGEDLRKHSVASAPVASGSSSKVDASTSTEDLELDRFFTGGTAVLPTSSQLSLEQPEAAGFPSLEEQHAQPATMLSSRTTTAMSPAHLSQGLRSSSSLLARSYSGLPSSPSTSTSLGGRNQLSINRGSSAVPDDQMGIIQNINILISELGEEKEALVKALRAESVAASELRALNAELSHKLEIQTQRLELAVAQSMVHGSPNVAPENAYETNRLEPIYVDEGDEVVDRVLGWIMQLFPSGTSRRKRL